MIHVDRDTSFCVPSMVCIILSKKTFVTTPPSLSSIRNPGQNTGYDPRLPSLWKTCSIFRSSWRTPRQASSLIRSVSHHLTFFFFFRTTNPWYWQVCVCCDKSIYEWFSTCTRFKTALPVRGPLGTKSLGIRVRCIFLDSAVFQGPMIN